MAELPFLLAMLDRLKRSLILEVEVNRDTERNKDIDHEALGYHGCTRLYLLRSDGRLYTLHGMRCLVTEADSET